MKFLIVCTGNTCRSPMAEGIFKDLAKKHKIDLQIKSAGTFAVDGSQISKNAIKALENIGIDIKGYKSSFLDENLVNQADVILTMTDSHRREIIRRYPQVEKKVYLLNEYAFGNLEDISDPFGGDLHIYELVRDQIYRAIEKIVNKE